MLSNNNHIEELEEISETTFEEDVLKSKSSKSALADLSKKLANRFLKSKSKNRESSAAKDIVIFSKRKSRSSSSKKIQHIQKHSSKAMDLSRTFEEIKDVESEELDKEADDPEEDSDEEDDDVFGFMKSKLEKKQPKNASRTRVKAHALAGTSSPPSAPAKRISTRNKRGQTKGDRDAVIANQEKNAFRSLNNSSVSAGSVASRSRRNKRPPPGI